MIREHATIFIHPDKGDAFESVFKEAIACISSCKGYIRHELDACIEQPDTYLLVIDWESLEDHIVGFRESDNFQKWRGYIQPFFSKPPVVIHHRLITSSDHDRLTPKPVTLVGRLVTIRPLQVELDAPYLYERSNGAAFSLGDKQCSNYDAEEKIWKYLFDKKPNNLHEMKRLLQKRMDTPRALCFCILDSESKTPIGVCNYMNHYPEHKKIELGGIWYSPIAQGTGANTEAIHLLLAHVFSQGYNRVEWKCDANNAKSRYVAQKLGFTFEGIQQAHLIVKDKPRDTAWFRLLKEEWVANHFGQNITQKTG